MNEKTKLLIDLIYANNDGKNNKKIKILIKTSYKERDAGLSTAIEKAALFHFGSNLFDCCRIVGSVLAHAAYLGDIFTAEHLIEYYGNDNIDGLSERLISAPESLDPQSSEISPLSAAAWQDRWQVVRLLLLAGARPGVVVPDVLKSTSYDIVQKEAPDSQSHHILEAYRLIKMAEVDFDNRKPSSMLGALSYACDSHLEFVLDYLSLQAEQIVHKGLQYHPIKMFIECVANNVKNELKFDEKAYSRLQEEILLHLWAYDAEQPEMDLFRNNDEKKVWLERFIDGASYESTVRGMPQRTCGMKDDDTVQGDQTVRESADKRSVKDGAVHGTAKLVLVAGGSPAHQGPKADAAAPADLDRKSDAPVPPDDEAQLAQPEDAADTSSPVPESMSATH